ncbi:MAG: HTH-type transcriptional repressor AseR [Verrucomicrobia bacterium ADurb.Bin345]|nr:MAG: HTH-type transcriptional repressor AseR [Verrucomicrobia bacterium ADurb.Bin345]
MNKEEAKARAKVVKALANPLRLMIVEMLSHGDYCVSELSRRCKVSQPTLSRHLARLKNAGIVSEYQRRLWVMHHLETPCVLDIVASAASVVKSDAARKSKAASAD